MGNYLSHITGHSDTDGLTEYDMTEVNKHNKIHDAWIVINEKVYDVSNFKHPGGDIISISYGMDATSNFYNKYVRHSPKARKLLKQFLIGKLKKNVESNIL